MTPQERQLVAELFERLAALEDQPRDAQAEQAIREELAKAPHALYALVQSVLVQDEALKQADAHIQELEAALQGGPGASSQPKGFLDNMRDTLFGREEPRGSVPSVRPGDQPMGVPPQYRSGGPWAGATPPASAPEASGRGGSFLGTAAAAAAGMIGGGLLLDGIRGMLGGHQQRGPFAGAFDELASGGSRSRFGGSEGGELAREAGLGDIGGGHGRAGLFDAGEDRAGEDRTAGLFDSEIDDAEFGDGFEGGPDDTDYA